MNANEYGILLVGCGHIGGQHLADIYYRDHIRIHAVADTDPEKARIFAKKYGARRFGADYREFLNSPETDIVIIATYADTHLEIFEECLRAGKHILCEKPIAGTHEQTRRFYHLAREARTKVLVGHILRHNGSYRMIRELIAAGEIGELRYMRMVQNHHAMDWPRYKRLLRDCPPVVDCGVHYLDVMSWFADSPICEVSGISATLDADAGADNYNLVNIRLQNGCCGMFEAGWSRNLAAHNVKEFIGDKGRISLVMRGARAEHREEGDLISLYRSDTGEYRSINLQSVYKNMYGQLCELISMIETDASHLPQLESSYAAHQAAFAAVKAMETRKPVRLENAGASGSRGA